MMFRCIKWGKEKNYAQILRVDKMNYCSGATEVEAAC